MSNLKQLSLFLFLTLTASSAFGGRSLILPPFGINHISGGRPSDGKVCQTADMDPLVYQSEAPVHMVYNFSFIDVTNISPSPQFVTLEFAAGTFVTGGYSHDATGGSHLPDKSLPKYEHTGLPKTASKNILAGETHRFTVVGVCSSTFCSLSESSTGLLVAGVPLPGGSCAAQPGQACLAIEMLLKMTVKIQQDQGAVIANIVGEEHRCSGWTDKRFTTPYPYAVNGGRPF